MVKINLWKVKKIDLFNCTERYKVNYLSLFIYVLKLFIVRLENMSGGRRSISLSERNLHK